MKLALVYAYDGASFQGSQTQPNGKSVEDALNLALGHIGINEKVKSSSRTDAQVHALNQVSTVNSTYEFKDLKLVKNQINRHIDSSIFIKKVFKVDEKFSARFDATARSYRYIINHAVFNPFQSRYFLFEKELNLKLLNENLKIFQGEHDFSEFMKTGSATKSPIREIFCAKAYRYKNFTIINFKANSFLRSQIRLIVANLLKADKNSFNFTSEFKLKAITRVPIAPNGLYLNRVFYN